MCVYASGLFTLRVPKETPGEHFEGLEMLTSLLAPKGTRSAKPLVEDTGEGWFSKASALSASSCGFSCHCYFLFLSGACGGETCEEEDEEEEFDWQIEQEVYAEPPAETLKGYHKYGFGNLRSGVFCRLQVRT